MISYDGHEQQIGIFDAAIETTELKYTVATLSIIICDRQFGLAGRDLLSQDIFHEKEEGHNKYAALTGVKGVLATIELKQNANPIGLPARELP